MNEIIIMILLSIIGVFSLGALAQFKEFNEWGQFLVTILSLSMFFCGMFACKYIKKGEKK